MKRSSSAAALIIAVLAVLAIVLRLIGHFLIEPRLVPGAPRSDFYHVLIRAIVYPAFYWIGFSVVKGVTLGKAIIIPYAELGQDEDAAWWEFRLRRWGYSERRPESMIILGSVASLVLVSGYFIVRCIL